MRQLKESGIEWIGKMPDDWNLTKLKYILRSPLQYGANESGTDYSDELPRYIRITDITMDNKLKEEGKLSLEEDTAKPYLLYDNDILFARSGASVGKTFIYKIQYGKAAFAGYLIRARINSNKVIADFVYYNTLGYNYEAWKQRIFIQSTIQNIGADKFNNYIFAYPAISKQQAIVKFLDGKCAEIDKILSKTRASIEEYKKLKQAVITQAVTKGLDSNVEMKDSGVKWIGMMPSHWKIVRGKYILTYMQKPVREDDGVITCFRDGEVTLRSNRREDGFTMSDKEIGYQGVDEGDLVVHGMDGFAGAIGISDSRGKASPVLNILDTKQNKKYIMYYLRSMAYNNVFLALATGVRVRSCDLRWNKLAELPYPIPTLEEQQKMASYLDEKCSEIDKILSKKKEQLTIFESYRNSLIYEYVTGKKEVPETWA